MASARVIFFFCVAGYGGPIAPAYRLAGATGSAPANEFVLLRPAGLEQLWKNDWPKSDWFRGLRIRTEIMTKEIRLNAFAMNCVAHQSPGLWPHPRARTAEYNRLPYWLD